MSLEPRLGWAALSRTRLNKAEAQLEKSNETVRDEVGVLALHTAYADRFFPGTSTQQTRLKYALFVPWQIEKLLRGKTSAAQVRTELEQQEIQLAKRLSSAEASGVIGARNAGAGRPVTIPPSSAYWGALQTWGILNRGPYGLAPTRHDVLRQWAKWGDGRTGRRSKDDEGRELDVLPRLFANGMPKAPPQFSGRGQLDFQLEDEQRTFLRERLTETARSVDGRPSLLAELAAAEVAPTEGQQLWSLKTVEVADTSDRRAIRRARKAASLSVIARALYAAAVEALREHDGGRRETAAGSYRRHLIEVVQRHGARATSLQLDDLAADGVVLPGGLHAVLGHVQQWVEEDGSDPLERTVYRVLVDWESARKRSRSKLPRSKLGREARREWGSPNMAVPIGYRWLQVRGLLQDLGGAADGL